MATVTHVFLPEEAQPFSTTSPGYVKIEGTNFPVAALAFDASTEEKAFFHGHAVSYGSGNLTVKVRGYGATATSGNVIFGGSVAAITPADAQSAETKAFGTEANSSATAASGTADAIVEVSITISSLDSIAAGDEFWLRVSRKAADASDTMTGDFHVVSVILTYSDT